MSDSASPHLPPNVVVFGPKANCTLEICPVQFSVYGYRPSLAANGAFIGLYIIAMIVHAYLGFIRWKTPWFAGCMVVGAINAIIGYTGRVMMYYNPFDFAAFMMQILCVTTGPVYYCAAIYVTLAGVINHLSPSLSRLPPRLFPIIFIPSDLFSLVLQGTGGGLSVNTSGKSEIGVNLTLAGLALQVFTLLIFCGFFGDYLLRYMRQSRAGSLEFMRLTEQVSEQDKKQRKKDMRRIQIFFGFMVLTIVLIFTRCSYRLAELHEGYRGRLNRDELLFIVLEGVFIVVSVFCLMVAHPGWVFSKKQQDEPISL